MTLSREGIVAGLMSHGFTREKAEAAADREIGLVRGLRVIGDPTMPPGEALVTSDGGKTGVRIVNIGAPMGTSILWPVRLTLPWSHLVSDNDKVHARLITRHGKPHAINVITREYADAREKIAGLAKAVVGDAEPVAIPLRIRAAVYMPDERPHDLSNFCKLVHDALERVVYANDRWLYHVDWIRAGVDVDAPRAEIRISPYLPG